jgi:hypothetical protein
MDAPSDFLVKVGQAVWDKTAGLPLYVEQMAASLVAQLTSEGPKAATSLVGLMDQTARFVRNQVNRQAGRQADRRTDRHDGPPCCTVKIGTVMSKQKGVYIDCGAAPPKCTFQSQVAQQEVIAP